MRLLKLVFVSNLLSNTWANTECHVAGGCEQAASLLQSRNAGASDQRRPWKRGRVKQTVQKGIEVAKKVVDKVVEFVTSPEGQAVIGAVANTYFEEEIAEIDSLIKTVDGHFIEFNAKKRIVSDSITGFVEVAKLINNETSGFPEDLLSAQDKTSLLKLTKLDKLFRNVTDSSDAIEEKYTNIKGNWTNIKNFKLGLFESQAQGDDKKKRMVNGIRHEIKEVLKTMAMELLVIQLERLESELVNGREKLKDIQVWLAVWIEKLEATNATENANETTWAMNLISDAITVGLLESAKLFEELEWLKLKAGELFKGL